MADIVKELYKGEVLFGNYVDGKQTLYSTDSTKTAVIKDVHIQSSSYGAAPTLQVSDFDVVSLAGDSTGSEIVGTNSTIKIKNNDTSTYSAAVLTYFNNINTGTISKNSTNPSTIVYSNSATTAVTAAQVVDNSGLPDFNSSSNITWAYVINGNLYYYAFDGNSSTNFYRREGLNGSNSLLNSGYSYTPVCFDGVDKFYWFYGGNLYRHNGTTNTTDTLGNPMSWNSGSTYPMIAYCNGIIFWCYTDGAAVQWYKVSDGTYGNMSSWNHSNYCSKPTVFYNATDYTYRIVTGSSSGLSSQSTHYYYDIQSNAANSTFTSLGYGSGLNATLNSSNPSIKIGYQSVNNKSYVIGCSLNATTLRTVYSIDRDLNLKPVAEITGFSPVNPVGNLVINSATTEQLNTYGAKISLRITGVESTL